MENTHPTEVIDENGAIHRLTARLGAGGQGVVWLVEGGRRIVKLLGRGDPEALRRQLLFVRRLGLAGLHVARPIAVLRPPFVGYVAEFLGDMTPLGALVRPPTAVDLLRWHIDSGGLRRRLRLLAHAGEALLGLHSRGVAYGDVSHHNVFVSGPVDAVEAWLIDLDNLAHDADPRRAVYTPGYGAPEIVTGVAGCTSLSDAWAFATLVWQVLTLAHPFIGDFVHDGEPALEEQAFAGQLPWVGHATDRRNACTRGLPPALVAGPRLVELATRTFERGLADRTQRPGVADWVERLHAAADQTVRCRGCAGTYFVLAQRCPWCDEPLPAVVPVKLARWQPDRGVVTGAVRLGQFPLTSEPLRLTRRDTLGHTGVAAREAGVELTLLDRGISVRAHPGTHAWVAPIAPANAERYPLHERERIVPTSGWLIFFEDPALPQRVALLGRNQ